MFKAVITKNRNTSVYLEYDKEKYDIEYVGIKNLIILRRLSDKQILEVFSDDVGFIVQYDLDQQTNFLVTDYSSIDKNGDREIKFKHYIDNGFSNSLYLKKEFMCGSIFISECRVTDSSFLVEQSYYGGSMYNLNEKSKKFDRIYNDKKINDVIGEGVLMVSEQKRAFARSEINDTIIYGINPETYEIVTPIWSELQQRYINVYNKEQVEKMKEEFEKKDLYLNTVNYNLDELTISLEVQRYLDRLASYIDEPKSIYLDSLSSNVNEEFVKKFVKNR